MRIRGSGESRAHARVIGLFLVAGALLLASCSSTHPPTHKKTDEVHKEGKSSVPTTTKVGGLTIKAPSTSQRRELARAGLSLADVPKGWQKDTGVQPINSLPNCSGYPSATLYGPVSAPVIELPESAGSSTTTSKAGSASVQKTASHSSTEPEQVADSAIWVASSSSMAKQVVTYLSSGQGKTCMLHRDTGATVLQVTRTVPGASAVASFLVTDRTQHISEALVVFSKGREIAMVFFASRAALSSALLNHALDVVAGRL
jgi:hypothetical protein